MNPRSAQLVAATLGFLLIVLIGAVIFIVLSRPAQGPRVSPTPTSVAVVSPGLSPTFSPIPTGSPSPSPSLLPTFSPEPSATPTALITPEITPEITPTIPPTPTPTASPTPTPTAPPIPTSPGRQIRVDGLGLDGRNPEVGVERYVLFHVDGPSLVRVTLSNTTGRSRVCLWEGDNETDPNACLRMRNGTREVAVFGTGQTSWTLSLIGIEQALGPVVDLTIDFNANSPQVIFENLRFQGQPAPNYNGINASVDALNGGDMTITGAFDGLQQHMYRVVIDQVGGANLKDESAGPVNNFTVIQAVTAATSYNVAISNPNPATEPLPVFLRSTFTWP